MKTEPVRFIHLLAILMVVISAAIAAYVIVDPQKAFSLELKGGIATALVVNGLGIVLNFFFGSSAGSEKKSEVTAGEQEREQFHKQAQEDLTEVDSSSVKGKK